MKVINDEYISKLDVVRILQKAYAEGRIKAKDGLAAVLDDINAADVQPIQHGKWIGVDYDTYFECSECKHMTDWQLYKYCPYCGARMNVIKDGDSNG